MKTVRDFVEACKNVQPSKIYELFEYALSNDVREKIITFAEAETPEPVRSAFNKLGMTYDVENLINY